MDQVFLNFVLFGDEQATVPVREGRSGDTKPRLGSNAWSRLCVQSSKDETVGRPKGLLGMLEKRAYDSGRQSWLPNYLTSNGAGGDGNGSSRSDRCMQDGSSLVRVCAHCGTSKTPLWRNGPQGPKVCGIVIIRVTLSPFFILYLLWVYLSVRYDPSGFLHESMLLTFDHVCVAVSLQCMWYPLQESGPKVSRECERGVAMSFGGFDRI